MNETTDRLKWRTRPAGRAIMFQSWRRLLFLHWRFEPALVQALLPDGLTVDTFDGAAWVAVVPFQMRNIRPAWSPAVPHISNFLELNVRTYVVDRTGASGVWFLSLTANRRFAVWWGRTWFSLPYVRAQMLDAEPAPGCLHYSCRRISPRSTAAGEFRYRLRGAPAPAAQGSLEEFLVERYLLFSRGRRGEIATGQVHHAPYQVQPVEMESWDETPLVLDRLPAPGRPPDHALYAPGVDVEVFALQKAGKLPEVL